jgi:hypothetical protein
MGTLMPVNLNPTRTSIYCKKTGDFLRFYFREGLDFHRFRQENTGKPG